MIEHFNRKPTPKSYDLNNILVIADMHEPFCKKGYLEHCITIRDKYRCGRIILIGDEVDLCGVSQWEKDPDGFSAGTEAELAQAKMKVWYTAFPEAYVCIGNHTARPFRQAKSNGVPKKFMKTYEEAWEAPKTWKWADSWEFNNIHFTHGTGHSGPNAAIKIATRHRQSTVIGHIHSEAGIQYSASKIDLVWGMQVGGALDDKSYAAHYAKDQIKKSIVGCGVILDGKTPLYEPMNL
jgi:predicted phosphodiesterase